MKVIIAGSRSFIDMAYVDQAIELAKQKNISPTVVICGCASGADTLGEIWAIRNHKEVIRMPADWKRYGRSAGYIRNVEMAKIADGLIAIWDGESKGTKHMIDIMESYHKPICVYKVLKQTHRNKSLVSKVFMGEI